MKNTMYELFRVYCCDRCGCSYKSFMTYKAGNIKRCEAVNCFMISQKIKEEEERKLKLIELRNK